MTGPVQISGLSSGLDTKAIIDAIMAAESRPLAQMAEKLLQTQQRQSALRAIRASLTALETKLFALTLSGNVNARSATAADSSILTATASATAAKGSFNVNVKQLATATRAVSTAPIGDEIDAAAILNIAGFATTPTSGTFTINGVPITVDVAVDSLNSVIAAINGSAAGVTATLVADSGGRANNAIKLTGAAGQSVQVGAGGDTSNFLSVTRLLGVQAVAAQTGGTVNVGDETAGSDAAVTAIQVTGTQRTDGYTFSYNAGTNALTLTRTSDGAPATVTLTGLPAGESETYDFAALGVKVTVRALNANGEAADDIGTFFDTKTIATTVTLDSQRNLGRVLATTALSAARLDTAPAASGTFSINGTTIAWDDTDTLNAVISRINASAAGVIASYDSIQDNVTLTAKSTGSTLISLSDTTGNLLTALNLLGAGAQTAGQDAVYAIDSVNGGADLSSASNTVSGIVPGVTLSLAAVGSTQVTIAQDAATTSTIVKAFVDQFNTTLGLVQEDLKYDTLTKTAGVLFGDSGVQLVGSKLRSLVSGQMVGAGSSDPYQSLMDIGISFGKVGTKVGTTTTLVLDAAKLQKALEDNPDAVEAVFKGFENSAVLSGTGTLASVSGGPTGHHESGSYEVTAVDNGDSTASLTSIFTPTGKFPQAARNGTIAAAGTNGTLIPGMVLTATGAIIAGVDTIDVTLDQLGVAYQVDDYLQDFIGAAGVFKGRDDAAASQIEQINSTIDNFQRRLDARRGILERQFAALESTLGLLQMQGAALVAQLAALQNQNQ